MMDVLYLHGFHREFCNIGDDVYYQGTISLLTDAIGPHNIVEGDLEMCKLDLSNVSKLVGLNVDLIVTPGAPWLYSNFHLSWQYLMMQQLLLAYPNTPMIAFGLGGCSGLNKQYFAKKEALVATYEIFHNFKLVFSRDPLTSQFLSLSGVVNSCLLDSAVFFPMSDYVQKLSIASSSEVPVMCYFDFASGISAGDFSEEEGKRINEMYQIIHTKYNPIVYCVHEPEVEAAKKIGIENCTYYWHYEDILPLMAKAEFFVSGRVHQAVLASLLEKKSYVIPFDIRYLCSTSIGVEPIFIQPDPILTSKNTSNFKNELISSAREKIVTQIKQCLGV